MYTALLRGLNRPRVVASSRSRSPFCLGTPYRCQSSEPEVAEQESEVDKPSSIGDAPLPAGNKLRAARDLGVVIANRSVPSQLPWDSLDTAPSNPQVSRKSNRSISTPPAAVRSRSRPSDASRSVSASLPWDAPPGVHRSSKSGSVAAIAPLSVQREMDRVGMVATDLSRAGVPPPPSVTRTVKQSNVSRHQTNAARPEKAQETVRLPWERMVDGLVSGDGSRTGKKAEGNPVGRSQSKLEQLTDDWARSDPLGNERLGGAVSQQQVSLMPFVFPPPFYSHSNGQGSVIRDCFASVSFTARKRTLGNIINVLKLERHNALYVQRILTISTSLTIVEGTPEYTIQM